MYSIGKKIQNRTLIVMLVSIMETFMITIIIAVHHRQTKAKGKNTPQTITIAIMMMMMMMVIGQRSTLSMISFWNFSNLSPKYHP